MFEYLQINVILFGLASIALWSAKTAPARIRFFISIAAIVVWLVPWGTLNIPLPSVISEPIQKFKFQEGDQFARLFDEPVTIEDVLNSTATQTRSSHSSNLSRQNIALSSSSNLLSFESLETSVTVLLWVLLSIGGVLFAKEVVIYQRLVHRWQQRSRCGQHLASLLKADLGNVQIRIVPGAGPGMATGLSQPIIWLSESVRDPKEKQTILLHELTHIQSHDVYWVWLITLANKFFWWNPLVTVMCRKARELIEFSCDERCVTQQDGQEYTHSLTQIILNSKQYDGGHIVLGIQKSKSFNVLRVKSLACQKALKLTHIVLLTFFTLLAGWISLSFANDRSPTHLFLTFDQMDTVGKALQTSSGALVTYAESDFAYKQLANLIDRKQYDEAERAFQAMEGGFFDLGTTPESEKIMRFRIMATMYDAKNQYDKVIEFAATYLKPDTLWRDRDVARVVAVAHIRLGNFQAAIDVLEKSESVYYRGDPTRALLAQAYHAQGNFEKSNQLMAGAFAIRGENVHENTKLAMLRLMAKNHILLGQPQLAEPIRKRLGEEAPSDFLSVSVVNQRIPHVYFTYQTVAGADIGGFDSDAFPMPPLTTESTYPEVHRALKKALRWSEAGEFNKATEVIMQTLKHTANHISLAEQTRLIEYAFLLTLADGQEQAVRTYAAKLIQMEKVHPSIQARAHFILSIGREKYLPENIVHFNKYMAMLPKPSMAADHELLERYFWRNDVTPAKASLERVAKFYEQHGVVPDIKVLNRLRSIYQKLGDIERSEHYRAMLKQAYPSATDFMYGA